MSAPVLIDGTCSRARAKRALLNVTGRDRHALFRRNQVSLAHAESNALAVAYGVLAEEMCQRLLDERVDIVSIDAGWVVMELELLEPSLDLSNDGGRRVVWPARSAVASTLAPTSKRDLGPGNQRGLIPALSPVSWPRRDVEFERGLVRRCCQKHRSGEPRGR